MSAPPAPKKSKRGETSRLGDESILCEEDSVDSPFTLFFLNLPDADVTEEEAKNLKTCFEAACDNDVCPQWIQPEDIERVQTSDDFYVVPCFRGKLFRKIQARHLKVYGPPIVFECLREQRVLPFWNHAVYSSVFDGAKISFTSIPPERRQELAEKVSWMMGVVGQTLYHETTHLVCGKADQTEKYKAAVKNSIKLMKVEWIDELWETSRSAMGTFSGVTRDAVNSYGLRVFEGMEMALTGIDGSDRSNLMQLVEEHGGKIPGNMSKIRCTHLITDQTKGQKYKKAGEWKLHIVQTRWIKKCIDLGHLVDERKYHPLVALEKMRSSTPKKGSSLHDVSETGPDVSSIAGPGGRLSISQNTSTIFGNRHRSSIASSSTSVVQSSTIHNDSTINGSLRRRSDQFATPIARTPVTPLIRYSTNQSIAPPLTIQDPIDELRKQVDGLDELFEDCMVYLCGIADDQKEKWVRFLNATGASRVPKFDSATNVIVLAPNQEERMMIRKFSGQEDIAIVGVNWVVECVKQKRVVSHEGFEWSENSQEDSQTQHSQGASQGAPPTPSAATVSRFNSARSCKTSLTSFSEAPPVQAKGLFGTHTFNIHSSIPQSAVAEIKEKITQNGGIIEEKPEAAEFVVCSHSYPINELLAYDTVLTDLYLDSCIGFSERMKLSEHALFVPLPRPPIPVFNRKVFYLQCPSQPLRNYVQAIIESRGGIVTDVIDTKTATIVMMERGKVPPKYRSRIIVDLSFVVASMSECRVQAVNDHLYKDDTEPLSHYQREDDVWSKAMREKDTTQEIEELEREEERLRDEEAMDVGEQEVENRGRLTPLENPYFPDLRQPYKMNLHLDGVSEIINNMPSPIQETPDSLTTSRVGSILRKAVVNTGRIPVQEQQEPERISRPPSAVVAENRRTVSSTPVLQRKQQDQQRFMSRDDDSFMEQNQEHVEELNRHYALHPHFLLSISDLSQEAQNQVKESIEKLGGIIDREFSPETSNLIAAKLNRTPKTLSSVAAGKWCLTPDYISESVTAGHWLDEERFEWNPAKVSNETTNKVKIEIERNLARVCSQWRIRIARMPITSSVSMAKRHNGAFSGWKCFVHEKDTKTRLVLAVLEAGGAQVITICEYVEAANHEATIAFAAREFDWNVQSAAYLKERDIPIYVFDYIYEFLVRKGNEDLSRFLHPNYQKA